MRVFEKLQTVIMLLAAALGMLLGHFPAVSSVAAAGITPALMAMLFGLFLGIPLKDLGASFGDRKFALTSLFINFVWIPVLGWWLGGLFLADSPALRIGFIMLLVTPCTDWYLLFTSLAKGNVPLSAAILPLNLIAQIALLPLYLSLFAGLAGYVDRPALLKSAALVLIVPFGLAHGLRWRFKDEHQGVRALLSRVFSGGQFIWLCLAIVAMFASQGRSLYEHPAIFLKLLWPVVSFFALNFMVVRILAKAMRFSFPDSVSLSMTTLARNSPIALALAVTAFPTEPLIALALVIGPLLELPILGLVAQILLFLGRRRSRHPGQKRYS